MIVIRSIANKVCRALQERCPLGTVVTIDGGGMNWHCVAQFGDQYCSIGCGVVRKSRKRVDYTCYFRTGAPIHAMGRTQVMEEAVEAAVCWMLGENVNSLHRKLDFVDARMRSLIKMRETMLAEFPEIADANPTLQESGCYEFSLHIEAAGRSCTLDYDGHNDEPDCVFEWDGTEMFKLRSSDFNTQAALVKRWVCDQAMPSEINREHPFVELRRAAACFEAGHPLEGEFVASWDSAEEQYGHFHPRALNKKAVARFIGELRNAGFDRTLRAGMSMSTLILSRSRFHGLRENQPWVSFYFENDSVIFQTLNGENETIDGFKMTPLIESTLRMLNQHPVD